jgi:hypothetical protein
MGGEEVAGVGRIVAYDLFFDLQLVSSGDLPFASRCRCTLQEPFGAEILI